MFVLPSFSRISSWFGYRNAPTKGASRFHKGMDFAAPAGTPVFAAADGVISVKGTQRGYGNVVYIKHADGSETRYGHMSGFTDIQPGQVIHEGDQIGFVGSTGVSTGPHLHFEVRNAVGQAVDPQFILNGDMPQNISSISPQTMAIDSSLSGQSTGIHYRSPLNDWKEIEKKLKEEDEKKSDYIAFAYQAGKKESTTENVVQNELNNLGFLGSLVGIFGGGLLGKLFGASEQETEKAPVQFTLSKKDMKNKGFTDEEIDKISELSEQAQTKTSLDQAGQLISAEDLRLAGFDEEKIEQFNTLAHQKQGQLS